MRRRSSTSEPPRRMATETVSNSTGTSDASLSHTAAAFSAARSSTCANEGAAPPSNTWSEVTPASEIPQGTMAAKSRRSVETLSANPCEVIQREMCTPMAATFPAGFQMPTRPATRRARFDQQPLRGQAVLVLDQSQAPDVQLAHGYSLCRYGHCRDASRTNTAPH